MNLSNQKSRFLFAAIIILASFLAISSTAQASVQQTDDSAISSSPAPFWQQTLGNGLDFAIEDLEIRVKNSGDTFYTGELTGYFTPDYATDYPGYNIPPVERYSFDNSGSSTLSGFDGKVTLTASSFPLNPNRYYKFSINGGDTSRTFQVYGSASDTYSNGKAYYSSSYSFYPCGSPLLNPEEVCEPGTNNGIADIFFDLETAETLSGTETAVTTEATRQEGAVIDGDIIAWMENSNMGLPNDIYAYEISTGRKIRITNDNTVKPGLTLMLADRKILWTMYLSPYSSIDKATFIYDLDTGTTTEITEKIGTRITVSDFDGQRIVLQAGYVSPTSIYLYDLATSQLTLIDSDDPDKPYDDLRSPKISGNKILYKWFWNCGTWCGQEELRLYNIATGEKTKIFNNYGFSSDYVIDGDNVVVVIYGQPSPIYRYKISTGELTLISSSFRQTLGVDISGNIVVWSDHYDIFMYDLATGKTGRTGIAPKESLSPKVSGNTVVWDDYRAVTNESSNIDIYMYQFASSTNQPPVASFTFQPENPKAGEEILFDASSSYDPDPDGQIVRYEWDWDDDGEYEDSTASALTMFWWPLGWDMDTGGQHTVRLRVTDNSGNEDTVSQDITVQSSPASQSNAALMAGLWGIDWGNIAESFKNRWNGDHADFVKIDERLRDYDGNGQLDTDIPLDWLRGTEFDGIRENDLIRVLNEDFDPQNIPGFTNKVRLLGALYEEEFVDQAFKNPTPTYSVDILARLVSGAIGGLPNNVIRDGSLRILELIAELPLKIGGEVLHHVFAMNDLFETFSLVDQRIEHQAFSFYFLRCSMDPGNCDLYWDLHAAPVIADDKEEETKTYFEALVTAYKDKGRPESGLEIKAENTEVYKQFILSVLDKHRNLLPDRLISAPQSPVELRVYDAQGNVSGLVDGNYRQDIPNSVFDPDRESVEIFYPEGNYSYSVVGTENGTYGLGIRSLEGGSANVFTASDIPTSPGAVHQYFIDWDALSRGEKGVTLQIDADGDGVFEQTIKADATLQPPTADINGPYEGNEGSPISFDASGSSDPDGEIILYEWDFDGDGIYDTASASSTIARAWGDDYQGEIILRVTDDEGLIDTATTSVIINNVAPIVSNLLADGPAHPNQEIWAGDALNFSGDFADAGWLDTHTAEWNFGNGTTAIGAITQENNPPAATGQVTGNYVYYNAGTYTITLAVTDDDGGVSADTLQLVVKPIPATVDCNPETLNLKSGGKWIACYIELPVGYDVWQIDGSTVFLNGVVPIYLGKEGWAKLESNESNIIDHDEDGILKRMVKFDREAVQSILSPGQAVVLTITGKVFSNQGLSDFEGLDTIRVIEPSKPDEKDEPKK